MICQAQVPYIPHHITTHIQYTRDNFEMMEHLWYVPFFILPAPSPARRSRQRQKLKVYA